MTWRGAARAGLAVACAAALSTCAERHPADPVVVQARTITATSLLTRVAALADDSMRGRPTPSPELDRAVTYAAQAFSAAGLDPGTAGYTQTWSSSRGAARNVVAILPGAEPGFRDEYVVFLAHLDHIGVVGDSLGCVPVGADSLCNGADDNASGAAAVLELARAYGGLRDRPRRSMIFLLVTGEELGLQGTWYFVAHPVVPLTQIVAAINFDMIGRNAQDSILVVGADRSSLGSLLAETGPAHPELELHATPAAWMGGSDHVPFDNAGVPVLWFFGGVHPDLHHASDAVDRIDAEKAARVTRLAFFLGFEVANRTPRPARNAPAPPSSPPDPFPAR